MSLSSEQDLLSPLLLRDSITELLNSAAATMKRMQQQARGDGYEDMYCKGYAAGVEFSREKVEAMWEEFKGVLWSSMKDNDDMSSAIEEYEALEKEVNQ